MERKIADYLQISFTTGYANMGIVIRKKRNSVKDTCCYIFFLNAMTRLKKEYCSPWSKELINVKCKRKKTVFQFM